MQFSQVLHAVSNGLEIKRIMDGVRQIDPNDLLHRVGLERQRSTMSVVMPAIGFFVAGAAIGVGLAVLLSPSNGAEVRSKIAKAAADAKQKVEGMLSSAEDDTTTSGTDSGRGASLNHNSGLSDGARSA